MRSCLHRGENAEMYRSISQTVNYKTKEKNPQQLVLKIEQFFPHWRYIQSLGTEVL